MTKQESTNTIGDWMPLEDIPVGAHWCWLKITNGANYRIENKPRKVYKVDNEVVELQIESGIGCTSYWITLTPKVHTVSLIQRPTI